MFEWIQSIDWAILHQIQDTMQCGFMDFIMPKITMLGDNGAVWIAAAVAMLFFKKYRKQSIFMLLGLLIGVIVCNLILKNVIARDRPCWLEESFALLIPNPSDFSFPSGHTASSVIAATMLTLTNKKFALFAIPVAVLIIFSRMYLYVHFPSDVLFAVIIGLVIGFLMFKACKKTDNIKLKSSASA